MFEKVIKTKSHNTVPQSHNESFCYTYTKLQCKMSPLLIKRSESDEKDKVIAGGKVL